MVRLSLLTSLLLMATNAFVARYNRLIPTPPFMSWDPKFTQPQEWNGPNDGGMSSIDDCLMTLDTQK